MPFKNEDWTPKTGIPAAHLVQIPSVEDCVTMGVPDGEEFDVLDPELMREDGTFPENARVVATYVYHAPTDAEWKVKRTRAKRSKNGAAPAAKAPETAGKK